MLRNRGQNMMAEGIYLEERNTPEITGAVILWFKECPLESGNIPGCLNIIWFQVCPVIIKENTIRESRNTP